MTKYNYGKFRIIGLVVIIPIIAYFIIKFRGVSAKIDESFNYLLPPLHSISSTDSTLISKRYISKISPNWVYRSKIKNSVSFLTYDSSFNIISLKIITAKGFKFANNFMVLRENSDKTVSEVYSKYSYKDYYTFYNHSVAIPPVRQVRMTISTDSLIKIENTESIISYSAVCKNISVSYDQNGPVDIFLEGNELGFNRNIGMHLDILFLKRQDSLFLMIMSPDKPDIKIDPKLLFNIIRGN